MVQPTPLLWLCLLACRVRSTDVQADALTKMPKWPFDVYVGYYVESIGSIDQQSMTYTIDLYMQMSWKNENASHDKKLEIINNRTQLAKMWLPDVYVVNQMDESVQWRFIEPRGAAYVWPDGTISFSSRYTMILSCQLDLRLYPVDEQELTVQLMTFANPSEVMRVRWFSNNPVEMNSDLAMAQFEVTGIRADFCNGTYKYAVTDTARRVGDFSCLIGRVHVRRFLRYYIVRTIIPQCLVTIVSFLSFWIDKHAVPARITLSFTTLLTMTTLGASLYATLPSVSYSKAIDYWYGACLLFVVCALLEFALVNDLLRRSRRYAQMADGGAGLRRRAHLVPKRPHDAAADDADVERSLNRLSDRYAWRATRVDCLSRLLFPLAFCLFCAVFWLVCATGR